MTLWWLAISMASQTIDKMCTVCIGVAVFENHFTCFRSLASRQGLTIPRDIPTISVHRHDATPCDANKLKANVMVWWSAATGRLTMVSRKTSAGTTNGIRTIERCLTIDGRWQGFSESDERDDGGEEHDHVLIELNGASLPAPSLSIRGRAPL